MYQSLFCKISCNVYVLRQSNINFYVVDEAKAVKTTINNLDDIGPQFNFFLKVGQ